MRTAAFSIISSNYGHYAQALMASVRQHHPDWDRFVLIVGETVPFPEDLFVSVPLDALPLPHARQFQFRYTLLELNTAVKPWMFEHVFARGYDRVVYFDPDVFLFSALDELEAGAFLTLTPHLTGFIGGDGHPSERSILLAGTYNLGFLAVTRGPELQRFLGWWQEKLEFQSVIDTARGLFVDQRWMDLAPGLFGGVAILRHEGYNVAYWNLRQRTVRRKTDRFVVNGVPLRFFHFSGFDPAFPDRVSVHDFHLTLDDVGDARAIFDDYAALLREAGSASFQRMPYAFARFADGTPVPDAARIAYRESAALQAAAGDDPFAHPELFRGIEPERKRGVRARHMAAKTYQTLSRARPVVGLFPKPLRTAMRELLLGKDATARNAASTPGVNVIGHGETEALRLFARSCASAGLPHRTIDLDAAPPLEQQPAYGVNVFPLDAGETESVLRAHPQLSAGVAYWDWDTPELPEAWLATADRLQEIWVPSSFQQSAIGRKVAVPVVHMPYGIEVSEIESCSAQELGVPAGRFTFLCTFDHRGAMSRENPLGAIDAFRRAFPEESSGAALLVATAHGAEHPRESATLRDHVRGANGVFLFDGALPRARAHGLLASCDAFVSLHRSVGFGIVAAKAMCLGKPVLATGWSGNLDFMNAANSCLVDYELTQSGTGPRWAEPDLAHAAHLMRRIADDEAYRTRLATRARATMRESFSSAAAGKRYRRRLATLGLLTSKS